MAGSVQLAVGAQCFCGNRDAVRFRHYYDNDEHLGSFCLECKQEYLKEDFFLGDSTMDRDKILELGKNKFYEAERLDATDSGAHMVHPNRTRIENLDLFGDYLKPGDHIAWQRPYVIWHHALVTDIDVGKGKVRVIHWHGNNKRDCRIQEEWLDLKQESGNLCRINYEEQVLKENPLRLVIARARSRLDDFGYRFFEDNCEAFVTYCKKGIAKSQQVVWLKRWLNDRVKVVLADIKVKLAKKGLTKVANASFQYLKKVGAAEFIEKYANNCQWVGFGLVVCIEGSLAIYDLKELYEARRDGGLTRKEFMEQVTKRITEAICAGVPAALGGLTPGLAGVFVGVIFGTVGKILGAWIGPFIGRAITSAIFPDDKAVDSIRELHTGDQIVFYGNIVHPRHHCIVLWHDEEENKVNVIHHTYKYGVVQEWVKFVPPFYKVMYQEKDCHPPEKVCSRAISKLGTNEYDLLTYNCKHFAEWCKKI